MGMSIVVVVALCMALGVLMYKTLRGIKSIITTQTLAWWLLQGAVICLLLAVATMCLTALYVITPSSWIYAAFKEKYWLVFVIAGGMTPFLSSLAIFLSVVAFGIFKPASRQDQGTNKQDKPCE